MERLANTKPHPSPDLTHLSVSRQREFGTRDITCPQVSRVAGPPSSCYVDRRRAHAGAGTTAARSRCSQAEEDLLRMPRDSQAAR